MILIEPCSHIKLDRDESEEGMTAFRCFPFSICSQPNEMQAFVGVCAPEDPDGSIQLSEAQTARLLCHFMVQRLPDAAFDETVETLAGMYDYYRESRPALPAPESTQSFSAVISGGYTEPVYPVSEE